VYLSIVVISYNTKEILKECLNRIKNSTEKIDKEIIIVDNASTDGSPAMIKQDFGEYVLIINKENVGFARANNQGIDIAKGRYILLINSDVFVREDSIEKTINCMGKNSNCGILGVRVIDRNGRLQPSGRYFPTPWRLFLSYSGIGSRFPEVPFLRGVDNMKWDHKSLREVDWVPGCFFLLRRKLLDEIGFFDPDYYLYYEEIDLCLRAKRKGWKIIFYPETEVIHLGGESAKKLGSLTPFAAQIQNLKLQSEFKYFRKNFGIIFVILDFIFILLFNLLEILKKAINRKKQIKVSDRLKDIEDACQVLFTTRFGTRTTRY